VCVCVCVFCFLVVLELELRASQMLSKCSTTDLYFHLPLAQFRSETESHRSYPVCPARGRASNMGPQPSLTCDALVLDEMSQCCAVWGYGGSTLSEMILKGSLYIAPQPQCFCQTQS
jgi:hypothetical protein